MKNQRRQFMQTSVASAASAASAVSTVSIRGLGVGFVAAAQPVIAAAIQTDFTGIEASEQTITVAGAKVPLYVARPTKSSAPLPIIIVASEIFGVHEHIADVVRRFAKLGYLAIAPEFFARAGDPNTFGTVAEIMSNIVAKTPDAEVLADIKGAIVWARTHGGDVKRVGVTGFCWGGRITWLAATLPEVRAGVAWYGRFVGVPTPHSPRNPVDIAAELKAPVLGLYGGVDTGIPLDTVEKMRAALTAASATNAAAKASRIEVYPDTPHAFHADYRESYRAGPAKDGWDKCLAWFKQNGVA